MTLQNDGVALDGWCLPIDGRLGDTELVVNGVGYRLPLPTPAALFAELYPWYPNALWSSFRIVVPYATHDLRTATELTVLPRSISTGKTSSYALHLLQSDLNFAMPPADVAARIGATNLVDYTILGRSIYRAFEKALKDVDGRDFTEYGSILDWGCGSGRVGRHVVAGLKPGQSFKGFDIDTFAVDWANSRFGPHFEACATSPPLNLPKASIDLAYAYSVFTHLAQADLRAWQAELARVIKPGGLALFTVLSDWALAALFPAPDRTLLEGWKKRGIYDSVANAQLDTIDVAKDYYRNVWLKRDYIDKEFGKNFEIVDFAPGFHFYQSLVVARRR
ncbi:MAG: class I SAM-dependent methyltransferase [Hyphomonas sp.]|nr:class I SAM-dependent methyltransferase [Hyphomonas sp.]